MDGASFLVVFLRDICFCRMNLAKEKQKGEMGMVLVATRNHKKNHIVYHKPGCIYERRIHPDNSWHVNPNHVHGEKFHECKYCAGLKGDIKIYKKQIAHSEKNKNIKITFDETETIYVKTSIGFWKFFVKKEVNKYLLYHRNVFDETLSMDELMCGEFRRQTDVKETSSFMKLIEYIIAHDKAKIIMMKDYRKLPKTTKRQKMYYKKAANRERRKKNRRIDSLFAKIEAKDPTLKAYSMC